MTDNPTPIGKKRRKAGREPYDPQPLIECINRLLEHSNESYRQAALGAGVDHQAFQRILKGQRPQMHICILLADHFGINPNEFLQLAGWPVLKVFDIHTESAENLPPEAVEVALDVARIPDPGTRKEVAEAIRILLKKYF
jgi:hypothetical protein